jgi:hypothetical protein
MRRIRHLLVPLLAAGCVLGQAAPGGVADASAGATTGDHCRAGTRTLAPVGSVMYPDTGNGGYSSVHTDVYLRYRASTNTFLPGTHVVLSDRANRCLTSVSVDLERHEPGSPRGGPDLQVRAVSVDGVTAAFRFVQPTYPGDPHGQDDPDPRAHEVSQDNPVGGPHHNPLPPACSPELTSGAAAVRDSHNGDQCPRTKLVAVPARPIPAGASFTIEVDYVGHPGVHHDGDGSSEGWFRTAGGSSMTMEPVGAEDWMPLNDYPTAKPSYDFYQTTELGKTALANGRLLSRVRNSPDGQFPHGSATWHWHAPMPIASYLALSMIGDYSFSSHETAQGMPYYEAQDRHISSRARAANRKVMARQAGITRFESRFNGPFPFSSDGVVAAIPGTAGDTEEMETMIVFTRGHVGLRTLYHENMHQWWGDNVSEHGYEMTFFKEGLATLAQVLLKARSARTAAVRAGTGGIAAFHETLVKRFDHIYARSGDFWLNAPSDPAPYRLFNGPPTYIRPAATYLALWQILGRDRFLQTLQAIQRRYGGSSITEPELERRFALGLPSQSRACETRLSEFFSQWFDTGYAAGGGRQRPSITGPGLSGGGFYGGRCQR